jgi:hypothetical protein
MPSKPQRERASKDAKYSSLGKGAGTGVVAFRDVTSEQLVEAIRQVTDDGDAITFGRTSDNGAIYIGVLAGGAVFKSWASTAEELQRLLEELATP